MISKKQVKFLRSLSHDSNPVIWIGQHGLTEQVLEEINSALDHHELIKIKIRVGDRELRDNIIEDICDKSASDLVRKIGNTLTIFRRNKKDQKIALPE